MKNDLFFKLHEVDISYYSRNKLIMLYLLFHEINLLLLFIAQYLMCILL